MQSIKAEPGLTEISGEFRKKFYPAKYYLSERQPYIFEFEQADQLLINDQPNKPIYSGTHLFRVCIENSLGLTKLQPMCGSVAGETIWVEVYSNKFAQPEEHLSFYQALVDDLFRQSANLSFTFKEITQRGVIESPRPPTPLFTYYFLKQNLRLFEAAIETILAEPHRLLCDYPDQVMLHEADEVDGDVILSILQSPETWVEVEKPGFALSKLLRVGDKQYAPERVWQRLPEDTFDTPENRFVLHFLRQVLVSTERITAEAWWSQVVNTDGARAIMELASILRQAVAHPMFDPVGQMFHMPYNSQVLMRREGYHDLFLLWQQFNSSSCPLFDRWQQAMDMRAIHQLYEIWVYFKLIECIGHCKQLSVTYSDEQGLSYKSRAVFSNDETLFYNPTFHPRWQEHHSYSMVLRPDFFWDDPTNSRRVVLDAKFSMVISEKELDAENDEESPTTTREGYPVRENLYKMHTYRDALVGTQAAVILYPGTMNIFMPLHGPRLHVQAFQELLNEVLYGMVNGIGAIALIPGC